MLSDTDRTRTTASENLAKIKSTPSIHAALCYRIPTALETSQDQETKNGAAQCYRLPTAPEPPPQDPEKPTSPLAEKSRRAWPAEDETQAQKLNGHYGTLHARGCWVCGARHLPRGCRQTPCTLVLLHTEAKTGKDDTIASDAARSPNPPRSTLVVASKEQHKRDDACRKAADQDPKHVGPLGSATRICHSKDGKMPAKL